MLEQFDMICVEATGRGGYDVSSNIHGLLRQGVTGLAIVAQVAEELARAGGKQRRIVGPLEVITRLDYLKTNS